MQYKTYLNHLSIFKTLLILCIVTINCSKKDLIVDDNKIILPDGYEERWFEGLRYGLFVPPTYDSTKSYPLIIRLHGYTDTTSWNLSWYNEPIVSEDPCIVFTPKTMYGGAWGNSWDDVTPQPLRISLQIIDSLKKEFDIDTTRIYVHGASMGGYGVFNLLYRKPEMFAAAFSICGGGNPETAEFVMQTPLWIFHGSDDDIVPIERSTNIYNKIIELGGQQTRYTEYLGCGHDAWIPAWQEPTLTTWFLAQKRGQIYQSPDPVSNFEYEFLNSSQIKITWDSLSSIPNTNNWIWYLILYRNWQPLVELDANETVYIDSELADGAECYYSIKVVSYFFKRSVEKIIYVPYPN